MKASVLSLTFFLFFFCFTCDANAQSNTWKRTKESQGRNENQSGIRITPARNAGKETYLLFRIGISGGGTPSLLKSTMSDMGYNSRTGFIFPTQYPRALRLPSAEIELGKHLNERKSLSLLMGLRESGTVSGYNGWDGFDLKFKNWVINPRVRFHTHATTFSAGPSALLIVYQEPETESMYKHTKLLPGLGLSVETVNRKKTGLRMGLFATLNLHPAFQIEPLLLAHRTETIFKSKLNPTALQFGFRFQFYKKAVKEPKACKSGKKLKMDSPSLR